MNENEILAKLQEAQKDQNFVDELNAQTTAEGLQKVLKTKGIDLTTEQVNDFAAIISANAEQELYETGLDNVAGGSLTGITGAIIGAGVAKFIKTIVKPKIIVPIITPVIKPPRK